MPSTERQALQMWYYRQLERGKTEINGKIFIEVNMRGVKGCLEIPRDASYIRFIANSWYVDFPQYRRYNKKNGKKNTRKRLTLKNHAL